MNIDFDDIKPYNDEEIQAAMARIAQDDNFPKIVKVLFPDQDYESFRKSFLEINSIYAFQTKVMLPFCKWVEKNTLSKISSSGFDKLSKDKGYLFTSNHRDIVLDACMLQMLLHEAGLETCDITFGSNLMMNQLIIDIGKSNKMFKVERTSNRREFAIHSQILSDFIRGRIQEKASVWIAQRNGRTKDGFDQTDQGLVKMFSMSGDRTRLLENLLELNITPLATSYQYEPCDFMKLREIYIRKTTGTYTKAHLEDMQSVLTGIKEYKGEMNITICDPITIEDLKHFPTADNRDIITAFKEIINQRIYSNYKLYDTNYIAYDLKHGRNEMVQHYTEDSKRKFLERINTMIAKMCEEFGAEAEQESRDIILGIYGFPVDNHIKLKG